MNTMTSIPKTFRGMFALVLGLALALAPTAAFAHPDPTDSHHKKRKTELVSHPLAHPSDDHMVGGLVVQVNSPAAVAGQLPAVHWGDTAEVADDTADLVYAGTGCTVASYAPVADKVRGNITLVESRVSATNPSDTCPAYTFAQKVQAAQAAGAIGFVHIPGEGEDWRTNATSSASVRGSGCAPRHRSGP